VRRGRNSEAFLIKKLPKKNLFLRRKRSWMKTRWAEYRLTQPNTQRI
jgi:hypothetical protein